MPGSTAKTQYLYDRCRWIHFVGGVYVRPEV